MSKEFPPNPTPEFNPNDKQSMLRFLLERSIRFFPVMKDELEKFPEDEATLNNPMTPFLGSFEHACSMAYLVSVKQSRPAYFWFNSQTVEINGDIEPYFSEESGELVVKTSGTIRRVETELLTDDNPLERLITEQSQQMGLTVIKTE